MNDYSKKAARPLIKGGLANALFVHAGVEALPEELTHLATGITILLPWGSLLKAVALPEIALLKNIARLCQKNATLRVILGYQNSAEQKVIEQLGLPILTPDYLNTTLRNAYSEAGFSIQWRYLNQVALKTLQTTWAKKLAYGKERQFVEILACFTETAR